MSLHSLVAARAVAAPDAVAVIHRQTSLSYGELASEIERIARGLVARGVHQGDRVLALAGNSPALIALYLAVGRVGAVYVPVSPGFREREGRFVLDNANPVLAVVEQSLLPEFASWSDDHQVQIIVLRDSDSPLSEGMGDFDDLGMHDSGICDRVIDEESGLLLCYTSGTTSMPKPVLHSHRSEVYNATTYASVWGLNPADRGVVALPLAWVYGLSTTTAALLVSGSTVILLDRFNPVAVVEAIAEHRATAIWGTMSMYTKILEVVNSGHEADLSSLRLANNGGEPCPPPLVRSFEKRTGVTLLGSYATSEARPVLLIRPGDDNVPEGSVGQLVPGADIKLETATGDEVPEGTGHALLQCPGLMSEYYKQPDLTAEKMTADGWFRSGDLLRRDENGYYFVVGRLNEMIIRSGANIAPAEIESELVSHKDVIDAAVVGVPDSRSGEAVLAYVVCANGARFDEGELREYLSDRLATYKIPQHFICLDELPRTGRGKLDRKALRDKGALL
ncbi:class I adenylate-forming enzyme family protein [Rhodococcus erythropolis]|uniref:class I adenylate-forming enzyme family protein n=1 Tax=Rhodococcus erythropolis TaxID=1833 RepID=UPI001BE7DF2A|nr:class I adenylate-forming enzyme family protein [Rhodococcus erythropolis]MBT2266091.1 acyl--CoA ligase [Rhodococcus erythropolis]